MILCPVEKGVDSNSPVTSESQGVQVLMPNLERLTEASSVLRERNDSIKDLSFEYNYDRRNSQMHNSLTDVKVVFDYSSHRGKA